MNEQPADPHVDICDHEGYQALAEDVRVPFGYRASIGHGIPRIEAEAADGWWEDPQLIIASYCPWCGRLL